MKYKQKHFLSLIIPVYRQEKIIVQNLKRIQSILKKIRYDYEMIVVIDGIVDKAHEKVRKSKLQKTKLVISPQNHGKSMAIRIGMSFAKGDYIMFIDSGMEIDPNGISMLLEHMEWYEADVIVGSKRHPVSVVHYSTIRKILSYGYYVLVKLFFGIKVHDTQAGIKIFRKEVLAKILPRLVEKKFAGDLEMLVAANQAGYKRIFEAPIKLDYTISEITSAATWQAIWRILWDTMALFYRKNILQFYRRNRRKLVLPKNIKVIKV